MKTKHGLFFGFVVLVLTAMIALAACGDNGDPSSPSNGGNNTSPPALTSAVVQNAAPNQLILTFSEATTADNAAGWSGSGTTFSGNPSGLGTSVWTVPLASNVTSGSVLTVSYDSSTGTTRDTAGNPLGSITSFAVTNNVSEGGDGGTGATPIEFEFTASQVSIRTDDTNNFPTWYSDTPADEGFSVKVNGETASIVSVFTANGPKVYIDAEDSNGNDYGFTSNHVVTVSYNGTGYFAGKLKAFTDKTAKIL
jgi:hypothetical protein